MSAIPSSGSSPGRVLVVGAGGTTGSRLTSQLVARGVGVTAADRSGSGHDGAVGISFDWYSPEAHDGALVDIELMYLIPPPTDPDPQRVVLPFLERARRAGVRRAVLHGNIVVGSGGPVTGIVERAVAEIFEEWAVIRPSWFMQNVTGDHPHARMIRAQSKITTATGDAGVGFIDAGDIASVATEALLSLEPVNADLVVTGPETLDYDEVAEILSAVSERKIAHDKVNGEELPAVYEAIGVPAAACQFLATMDAVVASGTVSYTTDTVERIAGRPPRAYREFAATEFRV